MIDIRQLSGTWGSFSLNDITFRVTADDYFVILGPCGSGKTLLLECVAGLHELDGGRVFINDDDVTNHPPEKRRIGLVYQQHALFPHLSVAENIAYGLRYTGLNRRERQERTEEMIDLLSLAPIAGRRTPTGLSGGEAQKVALARALAIRPNVLLLDEPLSSLDQRTRENVTEVLRSVTQQLRVPVIHVTHDYSEAASLASRVAVLSAGRLVQAGSVEELFWRPANRFIANFLGVENVLAAERMRPEPNSTPHVKVGGIELQVQQLPPEQHPIAICIRPEDVQVTRAATQRPNTFSATITEMHDAGFSIKLRLTAGDVQLLALVPRRWPQRTGLSIGSAATVELPPECIHVMPVSAEQSAGPEGTQPEATHAT